MQHEQTPTRQPLLWAALFLSAGIYVAAYAWRPPLWWVGAAVGFFLAAIWYLRKRVWAAKGLVLCSWFWLGALLIQTRSGVGGTEIISFANGQEVTFTAHVTREGYAHAAGPQSLREPIDLETETIESEGQSHTIHGGVRLTIYERVDRTGTIAETRERRAASSANDLHEIQHSTEETPALTQGNPRLSPFTYGTRWRIHAKLHPPRNFRNPGAFDYESYLRDNGISVLGSAREEQVEKLPGFAGSRIELWRTRLHAGIVGKIHELWPPPQAALMDAMVLGEDAFLRNATRTEFQRSGTYHVLVVSGMNLSILAFVIFWSLRQFRLDPALAAITTVAVSFAYAFVTGVGPPVWRAALMLAIYLGARLLYRARNMLNAIGAAALGVLVVDPGALLGASFQLTFLAVFIIAAIGIPILEKTTQPYSQGLRLLRSTTYDLHLSPEVTQFRLDIRLLAGRLGRFFGRSFGLLLPATLLRITIGAVDLAFVSALMQIGLALPMAFYFHRATTMGIPSNLAVVPLTEVLMPAAVAAVGVGFVSTTLAKPAVWLSSVALNGITGTVQWLGRARIADLRVATPSNETILVALTLLAATMLAARWPRAIALMGLMSTACAALWIALIPPRPQIHAGVLEMTSIDVGQGDSILLVSPEGRVILVDAGGIPLWMHSDFDIGEQVVSPYLWKRGFTHLDTVVITHPHADHLGGMRSVIANFRPGELWVGSDTPIGEAAPVLEQAKKAGMKIVVRKEGDDFDYGGAHLHFLAPGRDQDGAMRANDDTLVLTVGVKKTAVLLEGDAERATEQRIVVQHPEAVLLKVAHHGSASATSLELLSTLRPRYAVISVGTRNSYGHPRRVVLERLQQAGVKTYRTDQEGAVTFYLDGTSVTPDVAHVH